MDQQRTLPFTIIITPKRRGVPNFKECLSHFSPYIFRRRTLILVNFLCLPFHYLGSLSLCLLDSSASLLGSYVHPFVENISLLQNHYFVTDRFCADPYSSFDTFSFFQSKLSAMTKFWLRNYHGFFRMLLQIFLVEKVVKNYNKKLFLVQNTHAGNRIASRYVPILVRHHIWCRLIQSLTIFSWQFC